MGRARSVCYAASIALVLASASADAKDKLSKRERAAIAMTPEQIADMAEVVNDPMDTTIQISTRPFFTDRSGLLGISTEDKFIRVFIDKKTGEMAFQGYIWLQYVGEWQFFDSVNIQLPDGPQPTKAQRVADRVISCQAYGCIKQEDVAFDIPEMVMRNVALEAQAGTADQWYFRLTGRIQGGITTGMLKTEIAGALIAAEREKAKLQK